MRGEISRQAACFESLSNPKLVTYHISLHVGHVIESKFTSKNWSLMFAICPMSI